MRGESNEESQWLRHSWFAFERKREKHFFKARENELQCDTEKGLPSDKKMQNFFPSKHKFLSFANEIVFVPLRSSAQRLTRNVKLMWRKVA